MAKYRGKYPKRIKAISSGNGAAFVVTNDGFTAWLYAEDVNGVMPNLGDDLIDYRLRAPAVR